MLPELFALVCYFPVVKFLQAQSKMMAMSVITFVAIILHVFFNWLLVLKLGWGLGGAVLMVNCSWWFITLAQFLYAISGTCGEAWSGFSMRAFENLWGFVKLSISSALMVCLDMWYFTALLLFAGTNILNCTIMVAFGFSAATSVRVSKELGAGHPRTAKFSVVVVVISSFIIGILISLILIITQDQYPYAFTSSPEVRDIVINLTPLLALSVLINNVQPVISGVAIGAGWQGLVAYVNIACYYLMGIPLGLVLGYVFDLRVKGIWVGMLTGTALQTFILLYISYRTNWNKEASDAENKIKEWRWDTKKERK